MEKIWLKSYPAGIPAEIDVNEYASIVEIFEENSRTYGDAPAFSNMGKAISYAELDKLSEQFAAYLQQTLGLQKGERVALMMPNILQYPVALFGVLRAGLTVVNTNPLYTPRELKHQLTDSGATTIVILENFAHVLASVIGDTQVKNVVTTRIGDMLGFPKSLLVNAVIKYVKKMVPAFSLPGAVSFNNALSAGAGQRLSKPELTHDDIAFLQYTGGTTGVAKGAMLTNYNMVANTLQAAAWLAPYVEKGKEVVITALPLYHIFALTANCMALMKKGSHNVLITNPRDMPGFVKELSKVKFTVIPGVNTLFNGLLNAPGFRELDFSTLKVAFGGGMAVQRAVAEEWKKTTGVTLVEAYGLTETSPAACINPFDIEEYNGSIGLPIPSTECSIQNDDGPLAIGEVGELCVRGPQVMKGYWQRPEATDQVITSDGWLRTGDIAQMDTDGFVRIVDRKKDMILVSGFNVYPNEIEDVVAEHPGVLEVGAIGMPDARSGEVVKIIVVKKDQSLTKENIIDHCRKNLTGYKVPKSVEFVDELPKTNVGKILRRELRDMYVKEEA